MTRYNSIGMAAAVLLVLAGLTVTGASAESNQSESRTNTAIAMPECTPLGSFKGMTGTSKNRYPKKPLRRHQRVPGVSETPGPISE